MPKPKSKPKTGPPNPSPPPSWPPLKPPLPTTPLHLQHHPSSPSKILTLQHFFPRSLCREYVSFLASLPLTTTPSRPKRGEAVRVNDRFQVRDPGFAGVLWEKTGLKEVLRGDDVRDLWGGEIIGLNPNIRIYRYSKGQYFDCHYDDSNDLLLETTTTPIPARTTWTLLLYLTSPAEGCLGGQTVFYHHDRKVPAEEIVVEPETGMLLLHKHGHDCLLHEGREVLAGEKWILRTDLCVRR